MGKFLPGLLIGAAIALLIAPKKGDEMRLELSKRWNEVQNKLSVSPSATTSTGSAINDNADPITLPVDSLESVKPSSSPLNSTGTLSSSFGRTSADGVASAATTITSADNTTAPISTTAPTKPYTYNEITASSDSAPIAAPVETFEEIPAEKDVASQKLNTPYQNPGKSSTASRWLSNNQHRRGSAQP